VVPIKDKTNNPPKAEITPINTPLLYFSDSNSSYFSKNSSTEMFPVALTL